jgi:hypothetical protein
MKHQVNILVLIVIAVWALWCVPALADEQTCLDEVVPLEKEKAKVGQLGGLWSLFESSRHLRDQSVEAIKLDSKINQIVFTLKYLCRTLDGIPPNDLAQYIASEMKDQSVEDFRKEQKILGKSDGELDVWIQFYKFSKEHEHRRLNKTSVSSTIAKAQSIVEIYMDFAHRVQQSPRSKQAEEARDLAQSIDQFFEQDSNMATAIEEIAQVPHWDLDEDVGGS